MSDGTNSELAELITFHQVSQTLYRYASSVDSKDWVSLRSLFTDDAVGDYSGREPLVGGDAIVGWIKEMTADRNWQHHLINVYHVDRLDESHAQSLTYHTSHQTGEDSPGSVTLLVARYRDDLRYEEGCWRIARKQMETGWREVRTVLAT